MARAVPKARKAVGSVFLLEDVAWEDQKVVEGTSTKARARKGTKANIKASSTKEKGMVVETVATRAEFVVSKATGETNVP